MIKAQFIIIFVILNFCFAHESTAQAQNTQPFTFVQMCDTQLGFGGYDDDVKRFKQAVKQINSLQPDFVLICGDLVNKKDDQSFADFNAIKNTFTIPCYPASGNHDVGNQPTHETLANYRKKVGKDYYAVEHKGYTFIFTNTQLWKAPVEGESQKHHDWVVQTLKSAKAKASPVFMVGHYPLYVKDPQEEEAYWKSVV